MDELPAEYTIHVGDSLRLIGLRFYGPGGQLQWKVIYEANKETIGENPYILRAGTVLTIPALPENPHSPQAT